MIHHSAIIVELHTLKWRKSGHSYAIQSHESTRDVSPLPLGKCRVFDTRTGSVKLYFATKHTFFCICSLIIHAIGLYIDSDYNCRRMQTVSMITDRVLSRLRARIIEAVDAIKIYYFYFNYHYFIDEHLFFGSKSWVASLAGGDVDEWPTVSGLETPNE